MMLKLKDEYEHLADAAEMALAGKIGLSSFIVHDFDDERALRSLAAQFPQRSIRLSLNLLIHIRRSIEPRVEIEKPRTDAPVLAEVLNIRNDVVYNLLCDHFKAARTLLLSDFEMAKELVFRTSRAECNMQAYRWAGGLLSPPYATLAR
eukprot:5106917-Prymnesium_polylepis.3